MSRPLRGSQSGRPFSAATALFVSLAVLTMLLTLTLAPAVARADVVAPHVAQRADTDTCAMCHRTHNAAGDAKYRSLNGTDLAGDALVTGTTTGAGDTGLCFACHGVDAIGSDSDVESAFTKSSVHTLAPDPSAYGPTPKQCSDCHDSHGTDKTASGTSFPALLRSRTSTGTRVFSAEEYCETCHASRPGSRFETVAVYRRTAHFSAMPDPASGTKIRCLNCHAAHGSSITPLITDTLYPGPGIAETTTVIANDRTFCLDCHSGAFATWRGGVRYAASVHATSSALVSLTAEYAEQGASRLVGECQNCHDAMGRSDGRGGTIAKLGEKEGAALCLTCHTVAGPGADMTALSRAASPTAGPELVAAFSPASPTAADGRLSVYVRESTGTAPYALTGPRQYRMPGSARLGAMAAGDIDGDGAVELVAADTSSAGLVVFRGHALRGIAPGAVLPMARTADFVVVADVLPANGGDEIVVVNAAAHELYVYQYSSGGGLTLMDGPFDTGAGPSGLAAGDVVGSASADLVVTSRDDGTFRVLREEAGSIVSSAAYTGGAGAAGPGVGEFSAANAKQEIVVCASTDGSGTVGLFDGDGQELDRHPVAAGATGVLSAAVVADVLPELYNGSDRDEVVVALADASGTSSIEAFPADGAGGLAAPVVAATGLRYATGSLTAGDVDGDAAIELVAGNAGVWSAVPGVSRIPSVQVFEHDALGTAFSAGATRTYWGGGTEMAGRAPSLALVELGRTGPSRHPADAVPGAHVSTETAPFTRHVACTDCHDVHEAVVTATAAPFLRGEMNGAWGVQVTNAAPGTVSYVGPQPARYEYEVCFKCHSGWAGVDLREDVGMQFNPLNASTHSVEASSSDSSATAGSFAGGWSTDSVLYCTDCHGAAAGSGPGGPHVSSASPLLVAAYAGVDPGDQDMLCYRCHRRDVYFTGGADGGSSRSLFGAGLHSAHTASRGFGCASCHVGHGSRDERRLMRSDVGFAYTDASVSCTTACHTAPGGTHTYARP